MFPTDAVTDLPLELRIAELVREQVLRRTRDEVPGEPAPHSNTDSFGEEDWQTLPELLETWLAEGETDLYRRALEHFDRLLVSRVLQKADGNQARASEILGLSRVTLRAKMRALGLVVEKVLTPHSNDPSNG